MPKHDVLKGFDAQMDTEKAAVKRLGIDVNKPWHTENAKAMLRLLDRIEALEAKSK